MAKKVNLAPFLALVLLGLIAFICSVLWIFVPDKSIKEQEETPTLIENQYDVHFDIDGFTVKAVVTTRSFSDDPDHERVVSVTYNNSTKPLIDDHQFQIRRVQKHE